MSKKITRVSPAAMNELQQYNWPGNVRELENAVERAMVVAQEPELREQDFALKSRNGAGLGIGDVRSLDDVERAHILRVLEECGGNQTRAAALFQHPQDVRAFHIVKAADIAYSQASAVSRFQGKVLLAQLGLLRHHHGAFDRVFQLADIARPIVLLQFIHRRRRDSGDLLAHFTRKLAREVVHQQRNIFPAFAQRRNLDMKNIQTIEKVGAELALLDQLFQVLVGGGDHAEIDVDGLIAAYAHDLALLQHA